MRPISLMIALQTIIKSGPVFVARNFFAITLIVINLFLLTVSGEDQQNVSLALDSWLNDTESGYDEIIIKCMDKCSQEDKYYGNLQAIGCESYKDLCSKGCNQWKLSTFSTCKQVCHDDTWESNLSPCDLACISGCSEAVNGIMDHIKNRLDFRTPPMLINGTINGTCLTLSWPINEKRYSTGRLLLQWRYADAPNNWRYSSNIHLYDNYTFFIEKLQPYTNYRFRVAMILTTDYSNNVYSSESTVIQTMPMGVPSSAPEITKVLTPDHDKIVVFWKQGELINGPLEGYNVRTMDSNGDLFNEVTVPASENYVILHHLKPQQNYEIEVSMVNSFGKGPPIMTGVSTRGPPRKLPSPTFIVVGEYTVTLLNTSVDGSTAKEVYKSDHPIVGFDVLIRQQTFFVSDTSGYIYRINMQNEAQRDAILTTKSGTNFKPSKMSVDWLNSYLYILGEVEGTWIIARTDLNGSGLKVIVENLNEKPEQVYADPLNGYLFWTTSESGIFRLDLSDESWKIIYKKVGLSSFTVDSKRYLITSFLKENGKFIRNTFDGRFLFDNDIEVSAEMLVDLVNYDSNLYWTDGKHIYNNQSVTVLFDTCQILKLFQSSAQLLPIPTQPPRNVQALLLAESARLTWTAPERIYFQGEAAWVSWNYDLEIRKVEDSVTIRNIKTEFFTVEKLMPNSEYSFRVRATNGDDGPWSEWFRSVTWRTSEERYFLWASDEGILRSDEAGDHLETLLNGSFNDLTWVNGIVYLIKDSHVYKWDMSNITILDGINSAERISYDFKGNKLYFTDKSKGALLRMNLDGTEREILPILGVKYFELDPENGFIYYSTGLRIESCTLSGKACMTYFRKSLFSEDDLIGPAVNRSSGRILWMTQSDHDSHLFSASIAHEPKSPEGTVMLPLEGNPATKWISILSGRLIWSTNGTLLVIANETGENQALLQFPSSVNGVLMVEPTLDSQTVSGLIPDAIDNATIQVVGFWDNFNITWDPVYIEGGYNVSYSLKIGDNIYLETSEPSIRYPSASLPPYSPLRIWIRSSSPWSSSLTTTMEIFSPTAAPSKPQRLRAFIHRVNNPLQEGQNISAIVRWDAPEEPNGPIIAYSIICHKGDEFLTIQNSTDLEALFWGLEENITYSFQAQAFTSGAEGEASETVQITVKSEFQSIPKVLIAGAGYVGILDMDLNSTKILATTNGSAKHLASIREENRAFWIDEAGQLMSYYKDSETLLCSLKSEAEGLTVDWISRILYWSQADHGGGSTIHSLDLNQFEGEPLNDQLIISNPKPITDLVILPFSQLLLWLEVDGTISGWNLRDLTEINLFLGTNLTYKNLYPGSFEENIESVLLVDEKDAICILDLQTESCQAMKVGIDSKNFHLAWDNGFVYSLKNHSIRAYNRRSRVLEYMVNIRDISEISALNLQPYPARRCLLPNYEEEPLVETNLLVPQLVKSTKHSLELQFPKIAASPGCGFKIPGLKYVLFMKDAAKEDDVVRELHSFERQMNVTALKPFTTYALQLQISNYYANKLGIAKILGPGVTFTTAPGTPSKPRNVTVVPVSPRDGLIEWMHPEVWNNDNLWYEIHWSWDGPSGRNSHSRRFIPEGDDKWNSFLLSNLRPDHMYIVWLDVYSTDVAFNTSDMYSFETFAEPDGLAFINSTAYSLTVSWNASANVTSAFLLYSPLDVDDPISVNITGDSHAKVIESLEPKTKYSFHLKMFYSHSVHPYVWPLDKRFVFETLGDRPSAPGQPLIEHIKGEIFKIFWEPARSNGAPIEEYSLEALQSSQVKRFKRSHYFGDDERRVSNKTLARLGQLPWAEEIEPIQDKWIPYCNGTETNCIIKELHTMRLLMFRGRARNSYGWGPYSVDSEMIAEPFVLPRKRDTLVFAIIAPITIVSTCVSMIILFRYFHGRRKQAKKLLYESRPSIWGLDVATLQQVARSRNFSQTSSMLYTGKPLTDGDIALLPQISRHQITMQKFLGSGAFGEVYEGLITYSEDRSQDRVAIKTLRKGASEQEKTELLQEAHLMSHFKHENIVNLIGVCFDLDSICIIMELMEGGDLQSYLRHARPTVSKLGTLSLLDLVGMCLDVCTGCRYLEDLHFLHRDLACRNCLVSSIDPQFRVVKIGDFGLARDIYKSDYYRKEGEGLLPVRWMAPECLVDGVFTSQSDIWSFGILLWEILSLGQQPYPAQSNLEVLNFVKEGGRLQQPEECPDKLYKLMMQCWSHEPENRPTFQQCLNELLSMKLEVLNAKHARDYKCGILNMSFTESDGDSVSKVSVVSRDDNPSSLNSSFIGRVKSNQRNQNEENASELSSFKVTTPNEAGTNGTQPKRKSVHYVNEGRSRF